MQCILTLDDGLSVSRAPPNARWLGHRNINETYLTYSQFMPEAEDRAVSTLEAEYADWSQEKAA